MLEFEHATKYAPWTSAISKKERRQLPTSSQPLPAWFSVHILCKNALSSVELSW